MTDRELMQQALDALTKLMHEDLFNPAENAIEALRARLSQPEPKIYSDIDEMFRDMGVPVTEPEPVAWISAEETWLVPKLVISDTPKDGYKPVYAAPPQREWQGLTDEELDEINGSPMRLEHSGLLNFAHAIEAKLREKNA